MKDDNYNWWEDPKNAEEIKRLSWWEDPKNIETFSLPISVIQSGKHWIVAGNKETEKYLGEKLSACSQGETKEEAIDQFFQLIRITHDYSEECRMSYQRFVPLRIGPWKHKGGRWISVFGFHVYFRYGDGMRGGHYIPFTKLNVSFSSEWTEYHKYKSKQKEKA